MTKDWFLQIYEYNKVTNERLWQCIRTISAEQFTQDVDYSIGSVRNQVIHLASAQRRWIDRLTGRDLSPELDPQKFTSMDEVYAVLSQVDNDLLELVSSMPGWQIAEECSYQVTAKDDPTKMVTKTDSIWQILLHLINHATDHRAQILQLIHSCGGETFQQDMMMYFWDLR